MSGGPASMATAMATGMRLGVGLFISTAPSPPPAVSMATAFLNTRENNERLRMGTARYGGALVSSGGAGGTHYDGNVKPPHPNRFSSTKKKKKQTTKDFLRRVYVSLF